MTNETREWLRLEVGYESDIPEDGVHQPPMQAVLWRYFAKSTRARWAGGGATTIAAGSYRGDDWAARVIDVELQRALAPTSPATTVRAGALRRLKPVADAAPLAIPTGTPGTRCVAVGDYWINYRSYELAAFGDGDTIGRPWPPDRTPADAMVFATLVWRCWPQ